jgi:hypothetical protein
MTRVVWISIALLILLVCGCKLDCSNLPDQPHDIVVLPVRVENESDGKCRDELAYWKELATYYRDSSGCGYSE